MTLTNTYATATPAERACHLRLIFDVNRRPQCASTNALASSRAPTKEIATGTAQRLTVAPRKAMTARIATTDTPAVVRLNRVSSPSSRNC